MGELVIVTGPPGSGKSTVCDVLAEKFDSSVLVPGDWFFGLWRRGAIDPWLPEAREQANVAGNAAAATDPCRVGTRLDRDRTVTLFQPRVCYSKIDDKGTGSLAASR